jgi:hypothetical protein
MGVGLTALDVSICPNLTTLYLIDAALLTLDAHGLTQLTTLTITGCTALTTLDLHGDTSLAIAPLTGLTALQTLNMAGCTALATDPNLAFYGDLTSLDVSGCAALPHFNCYSNALTSLNVTGCTAITYLYCDDNALTSIMGLSTCTALTDLVCNNNALTSLDVSTCIALTSLNCESNSLTTLDVSGCTLLTTLYCDINALTSLDVSASTALTSLSCQDNALTALDVSTLTALTSLNCTSNALTALDVSTCIALTSLVCESNALAELDVTGCTMLTALYCDSNALTALDVSASTVLGYLYCQDNALTSLDTTGCASLWSFNCNDNQLTALDISTNPAIISMNASNNLLTQDAVDAILAQLVTNGQSGGWVNLSGNVPPSDAGQASAATLQGLSWTVTVDIPLTFSVTMDAAPTSFAYLTNRTSGSVSIPTTDPTPVTTAGNTLSCAGNTDITALDLSASPLLTSVDCHGDTALTSLNVTGLTALTSLICSSCYPGLTTLDISTNTSLMTVGADQNNLTQAAVDDILLQLVLHNISGGTAYLEYNAAPSNANSVIKGSYTALGPFAPSAALTQTTTLATATLIMGGSMIVGPVTGTPNGTDTWTDGLGNEWTPTSVPLSYADFLRNVLGWEVYTD